MIYCRDRRFFSRRAGCKRNWRVRVCSRRQIIQPKIHGNCQQPPEDGLYDAGNNKKQSASRPCSMGISRSQRSTFTTVIVFCRCSPLPGLTNPISRWSRGQHCTTESDPRAVENARQSIATGAIGICSRFCREGEKGRAIGSKVDTGSTLVCSLAVFQSLPALRVLS